MSSMELKNITCSRRNAKMCKYWWETLEAVIECCKNMYHNRQEVDKTLNKGYASLIAD